MKFCNINFNIFDRLKLFEIKEGEIKCIVPVNAQVIVFANTNKRYMNFINNSYTTFDGEVPLRVSKMYNDIFKNAEKLSGSDIVYDFCEYAKNKKMSLFFLGGKKDSNVEAVKKIREQYGISINGYSPEFENYPFSCEFINNCLRNIEQCKPSIVFLGFGVPKQEYFIEDNIDFFKKIGVKFLICSGGTFEFVSGQIQRAPMWIQNAGFEGIYRFFKEISFARLKRILYSFRFLKYIKHRPEFD